MHILYDARNVLRLLLFAFILIGCSASEPTATPPPEAQLNPAQTHGKELFSSLPGNCATCHSLQADLTIVGPSLHGIASRAGGRVEGLDARRYLEQSILQPGAHIVEGFGDLMPKELAKKLTTQEVNDLVEFLLTLQ